MSLIIYHNPHCSKSRRTLDLIKEQNIKPEIILYLKNTPSADELLYVAKTLMMDIKDILRKNEVEFKEARDLPCLNDNNAMSIWLEKHPKVIQRPIVINKNKNKGVIARPPGNISTIL